jgi:hypothetical protein
MLDRAHHPQAEVGFVFQILSPDQSAQHLGSFFQIALNGRQLASKSKYPSSRAWVRLFKSIPLPERIGRVRFSALSPTNSILASTRNFLLARFTPPVSFVFANSPLPQFGFEAYFPPFISFSSLPLRKITLSSPPARRRPNFPAPCHVLPSCQTCW